MKRIPGHIASDDEYSYEAITAEEMQEAVADILAGSIARIIFNSIMKEKNARSSKRLWNTQKKSDSSIMP